MIVDGRGEDVEVGGGAAWPDDEACSSYVGRAWIHVRPPSQLVILQDHVCEGTYISDSEASKACIMGIKRRYLSVALSALPMRP